MSEADGRWPQWIAHRAGGTAAPENTLAGVDQAAQAGFHAIEVDVRLAADGVPVVIHDETLARTAGRPERVADLDSVELATIPADAGFTRRRAGRACVPTLEALLARARAHGLQINLELKPGEESAAQLVESLAGPLAQGRCDDLLLSCFDPDALVAAGRRLPGVARALLAKRDGRDIVSQARRLGCAALHLPSEHCSPSTVAFAHQCGLRVAVWTVNDLGLARALFALGVDSIFTDQLAFAASSRPGRTLDPQG